MKVTAMSVGIALLLCFSTYAQSEQTAELASKVIQMRESVEEVSTKLEMTKADFETKLKSLGLTIVELENNIKREELKLKEITRAQEDISTKLKESNTDALGLTPELLSSFGILRESIEQSIPFKKPERLAALDELRGKLERAELSEIKVATNLWQLVEDELRLTKENAIYQQTIEIDASEHLADVIKIGTFALYFKTKGGKLGIARRIGNQYQFETLTSTQDKELVGELFDSLKKQIRMGVFTLPAIKIAKNNEEQKS